MVSFNNILILLKEPLIGVIIGSVLTGIFTLWTDARKNTLTSNQYLKRKQEEFCLTAIDFLMNLRDSVLGIKNTLLWHQTPASNKQNSNFEKVVPLLTLYTTKRMRKNFISVTTKLLYGIYCEKEFWFFIKQFSYELGFNKKVFIIDYFNDIIEKLKIKKDNQKTFLLYLIRVMSEMQLLVKRDSTKIIYCKNFIHRICQESKGILSRKFLKEIEYEIGQLSLKSSQKQIKICLDNLAPKFEEQLKKLR